jgi:hypothetical protein
VAVNKMDLVDFGEEVFTRICAEFSRFAQDLHFRELKFVPISALDGDNVVSPSKRTPWYSGGSLLNYLETVPVESDSVGRDMRLPVQYVIRPNLDFRGFAGQLASGVIRKGDSVMVLPSGRTSRVKSLASFDGDLQEAFSPMSVTVCLEDEIDISRGDMLVLPSRMPHASRRFEAMVVWMHGAPLELERPYLLKHTTQQVRASVGAVLYRVDINTLGRHEARGLQLNEIGALSIETHKPLFFDAYRRNRTTGAFIFIDPVTNATIGAGMILERDAREERSAKSALQGVEFEKSRLTPIERYIRYGHHPVTVWLTARADAAYLLERELFDRGCNVHVLADEVDSHLLPELAIMSSAAGLITICTTASGEPEDRDRCRTLVGADRFVEVVPESLALKDEEAVDQIARLLEERGFIRKDERGTSGDGI